MKRYGQIIRVKPDKLDEYKRLHANPPKEVNKMIRECNIQNYSIYHYGKFLFAYFEYVGEDFQKDMQKMAQDEATKLWWSKTDPCQMRVEGASEDVWWLDMEEVYHLDEE